MQDVAECAGVSPMSVSNVLRGRAASARIRTAVMQAVEALNYTPNTAARQLASASTVTIGLLHGDSAHSFFGELMLGALTASTHLGVQVLLQYAPFDDAGSAWDALDILRMRGAQGIILPPIFCESLSQDNRLADFPLPLIGVCPQFEPDKVSCVLTDEFAAARDMVSLLINKGHRRIGTVVHQHGGREAGYFEALRNHGIEIDMDLVVEGGENLDCTARATHRLLDLPQPPTAIFANNDDLAATVLAVGHLRGLKIPDDLAVAGFDDNAIAARVWPPLTSVRRPIAQMAALAVEQIVEQIRSDSSAKRQATYVGYEMVLRASTGD